MLNRALRRGILQDGDEDRLQTLEATDLDCAFVHGDARHLPMLEVTLYNWIRRGLVEARKRESGRRRWIVRADEAEVARLRERQARPPGYHVRRRWAALAIEEAGTAASVNADLAMVD